MKLLLHIAGVALLALAFGAMFGVITAQQRVIVMMTEREAADRENKRDMLDLYTKETDLVADCLDQLLAVKERMRAALPPTHTATGGEQ